MNERRLDLNIAHSSLIGRERPRWATAVPQARKRAVQVQPSLHIRLARHGYDRQVSTGKGTAGSGRIGQGQARCEWI